MKPSYIIIATGDNLFIIDPKGNLCYYFLKHPQKIKKCGYIEGGEMYTQAECIEKFGSKYNMNKVMEEGLLYRVDRGIYSEKEHVPELGILSFKYPKAIVTMRNPAGIL